MQAAGSAAQAMSFSANAEYEDVQNKVYCKWSVLSPLLSALD